MKTKQKPHDPGRNQRLNKKRNQPRLYKRIIHIFRRSINRKAHSEAVMLAGSRPRNAHLTPSLDLAVLCIFVFALNVKDYREG